MITWTVNTEDEQLISSIAKRAKTLLNRDPLDTEMDLIACHANGNPLRLSDLLMAAQGDFLHDIMGISRHLDRDTGKLTGFFRPRFSATDKGAAAAARKAAATDVLDWLDCAGFTICVRDGYEYRPALSGPTSLVERYLNDRPVA